MPKSTQDYEKLSVNDALAEFKTDPQQGLSEAEAQKRLAKYGYNEIPEKEESTLRRVFRRFWGPISWMIEIAALLSAVVRQWEDFVIILVLLFRRSE